MYSNNIPGFKHAPLAIALFLFTSCGNTTGNGKETLPPAPTTTVSPLARVNELEWLAGRWEFATPEGTVFEEWAKKDNGSLTGNGGFIKGKDTMISETILLEEREGNLLYIPTVKGQNNDQPVPFTLTAAAGDSFVFENPAHDFPSKITYRKVSATTMVAKISGKVEGKEESEQFELTKTR